MRWRSLLICLFLLLPGLLPAQAVLSLKVDDAITPAVADYIKNGVQQAEQQNAHAIIIELNTPGGLLTSTRNIVGTILNASVPVIVYVYPEGSRAATAGVFITLSAHIAAMSPGTNIGAAHPVNMRGGMDSIESAKATNDAAAFIRTIAQKRKRNIQWAEEAVRKSLSITETEALQKKVINLIADNPKDLLQKIDGDTVVTSAGLTVLHTKNTAITPIAMTFPEKFSLLLSNPNLMYILLLLGIVGILFEFYNPGAIFPGVIGGIALILAFYSMSILPVNYAGLALIIFAIILFLLEIKITSHGILALGGVVSLFLGSVMLIQTPEGAGFLKISLGVIITVVVITTVFFLFVMGLGLNAQKNKVSSGNEAFVGRIGRAVETLAPHGRVKVYGEIWMAESRTGIIETGQQVRVTEVENMKIYVEPV